MTSIAFPAIGTGILRFPHQITAKICFEESKKFVQKYPNTCVKDIHFVVYHQDQASITAFKQELRNQPEWTQTTSEARSRKDRRKPAAENPSMKKETRIVKNTEISDSRSARSLPVLAEEEDGEISVYVRDDVKIEVLKGDITKETTHVIAHLSNPGMSMGGGVARAIIKTGGKEIERECEKEKPVLKHSVVLTKAGRLQANYVAHMAAPDRPDPNDIEKCITNCLQEIVKRECKTISFPAIATGQLNMSPEKSAKAMLTAILVFLQISPGSLNTVRIVIHDQEVFRKFSKAIKKFLQGEDEQSPGIVRILINSFLNLWKSDSTSTPIKQEGTSLKSQLFLDIYADKDVTINEVVNTIDKITGEQMKKESIENELIEILSEAHVSRITEIGETHNVDVKIEKAINRIIINGHSEDISKVILQIHSIFNEIKMAENEKDTAEMVSKGVQWFWSDTDGSQVQYDVTINSLIEKAYIKSKKSVTFNLEEGKCEIVFDKMEETNLKTHQTTKVIRKDLIAKGTFFLNSPLHQLKLIYILLCHAINSQHLMKEMLHLGKQSLVNIIDIALRRFVRCNLKNI